MYMGGEINWQEGLVGECVRTYVYAGAHKQETITINEGFSSHVMQNGTCS